VTATFCVQRNFISGGDGSGTTSSSSSSSSGSSRALVETIASVPIPLYIDLLKVARQTVNLLRLSA
jgi:hypothetical protein